MIGTDQDVGQAVARLRGERTQQAIADAMRERGWKWSQATVWSVEKGERPLRLREAAVLASVLGSNVEAFIRGHSEIRFLSEKLSEISEKIATLEAEAAETQEALKAARAERKQLILGLQKITPPPIAANLAIGLLTGLTGRKSGEGDGIDTEA